MKLQSQLTLGGGDLASIVIGDDLYLVIQEHRGSRPELSHASTPTVNVVRVFDSDANHLTDLASFQIDAAMFAALPHLITLARERFPAHAKVTRGDK